jgi:branched-chain amino acid transport system permease protein
MPGQVSLGHAAFVGIGAYTCAVLHRPSRLAVAAGFAAAGAVAAAGGVILALPSLRLKGHYLAMATLGFGELMVLAFVEASRSRGASTASAASRSRPWALSRSATPPRSTGSSGPSSASRVLASYNITSLRPGRAMLAVHGSEPGAQACGVDVVGVKVRTFVVSALLAGLAGALYASVVGFVSPSVFTLTASITFLAMTVLGGTSSLAGPLAAAVLLTLLQYLNALIPGIPRETAQTLQSYQEDIYGIAIVLVVIFAPQGLAGVWRRHRGGAELVSLLQVRKVTKRFGGLTAVDDVSFDVFDGTIKALIGPNGAGKSTLFNALTGFDRPDEGSVLFAGAELVGRRPSATPCGPASPAPSRTRSSSRS